MPWTTKRTFSNKARNTPDSMLSEWNGNTKPKIFKKAAQREEFKNSCKEIK
jgi:predicted alpha-1,6-mannanase (GH76 family)